MSILLLLPYVLAGLGGCYRIRQFGALDNQHPRAQAAGLEGIGARVWAAQQNGWEAVAVFAPAVIVAHVAGADPGASARAALVVTGARLLYTACYVADLATLRSLIFAVGLGGCVRLFVLAARARGVIQTGPSAPPATFPASPFGASGPLPFRALPSRRAAESE